MSATDPRTEAAAKAMARIEGDVAADAKVRGLTTYRDFAVEALAAADAVDTRVQQLTDALSFYGDAESWRMHNYVGDPAGASYDPPEIDADRGSRARAALAEVFPPPKMNLNPEPLRVGKRDPVEMIADPKHRAPKCSRCGNIKAFCECAELDASQEPAAVSGEPGEATK